MLVSLCQRVLLIALALGLTGCGFQLRSYNFEGQVESFALTGQVRSVVAQPLRRTLRQIGLSELDADQAALVVDLVDQDIERRSVSTTGQANTAEYELDYRVRYRLLSGDAELLPATWIERARTYRIAGDNIVGSSEEQALLERELVADLVSQIVRTMDVASRNRNAQSGKEAAESNEG